MSALLPATVCEPCRWALACLSALTVPTQPSHPAADKLEGASVDGTEPKPQPMPAAGDNPTVRFSGVVLHTRTFQRDPSGKRRPRVVRTATPHPSAGRGGAEYAVRPLEDVAEGEQLQDGSLQDPRELRAFVSRIARNGNLKVKVRDNQGHGCTNGGCGCTPLPPPSLPLPMREHCRNAPTSKPPLQVHAMAGPWRMESALRCRRTPELALKPWRRLSARTLSFLLRAAYVWICVAIAVVCPFFGSISGLIGAVAFWPLQVGGWRSKSKGAAAAAAAAEHCSWGAVCAGLLSPKLLPTTTLPQVLLPTLMVLKIDGDNATAGWKRGGWRSWWWLRPGGGCPLCPPQHLPWHPPAPVWCSPACPQRHYGGYQLRGSHRQLPRDDRRVRGGYH